MKNILKNLRDDETIHIMEPDKGNGIVIVNRNEYIEKVEKILSDPSKFEKLLSDPLKESLRHEKHLRNFLLYLKKQNIIDDSFLYERLAPTGSKPGILYGLPKVHKANLSFRPILSAIGTHSYNISKYLLSLLNPLLTNRYLLSDTLNVPLNETIVITIYRAYNNSTVFTGFPLPNFKKLLNPAVKDSHFILNNKNINRGNGFQWV